jgi:membrane AbrB-like protein
MIIVGEAMGGDARTISLVHGSRILFVVMTVPFYFRWFGGVDSSGLSRGGLSHGLMDTEFSDILILGACAILGYLIARLLKIRSAQLIGPMVLSAAVHLSGLTASRPPFELVAAAQVVLGSAIGSRFAGLSLRRVGFVMLLALGSTGLMLSITAGLSALATDWVGLRSQALVLALSPGGLAEMGLIALTLGIDTAFVSTMHILRITVVILSAAPFFRFFRSKPPTG